MTWDSAPWSCSNQSSLRNWTIGDSGYRGIVVAFGDRRQSPDLAPSSGAGVASRTWREIVDLAFWSPQGTFGGHITVVLWPATARVWYWCSIFEEGAPLVTIVETELAMPRQQAGFELRGSGIWADQICEQPFVHWSYGLEAFAVGLDDPTDALGSFRGERVALGLDLEWEVKESNSCGGVVHGEVLLRTDQIELDGFGWRRHVFGDAVPILQPGKRATSPHGEWLVDAGSVPYTTVVGRSLARFVLNGEAVVFERLLCRWPDGSVGISDGLPLAE